MKNTLTVYGAAMMIVLFVTAGLLGLKANGVDLVSTKALVEGLWTFILFATSTSFVMLIIDLVILLFFKKDRS